MKPEPQALTEPLLDAGQAAKLLHVPRSTLHELVRSQGLPHVRIGRTLRFTRQDLSAWITANTFGRAGHRHAQIHWLMVAFIMVGSLGYMAALMVLTMTPIVLIFLSFLLATGQL